MPQTNQPRASRCAASCMRYTEALDSAVLVPPDTRPQQRLKHSVMEQAGGGAYASGSGACELFIPSRATATWLTDLGLAGEAAPPSVEVQKGPRRQRAHPPGAIAIRCVQQHLVRLRCCGAVCSATADGGPWLCYQTKARRKSAFEDGCAVTACEWPRRRVSRWMTRTECCAGTLGPSTWSSRCRCCARRGCKCGTCRS